MKQHNESKWGARYTKIRRPVVLLYNEQFETLLEARRRETQIKGWRREKKELLWKQRDRASEPFDFTQDKTVGSNKTKSEMILSQRKTQKF